MADLKMKLNTNNELRVKLKSSENINMKFDDYQKFKEEDPIFKDSPAYTITYNDINYWNNKSDFSGSYNDLTNKPNLSQYATIDYVTSGLSDKVDKETGMGLSQNSFTTEEKNKLSSLENYDDTAIVNELNDKADISDIPTLTSELDNDSGFITKDVDDLTYYPTNDSVNSIVSLKQNIIDSSNKLSADYVDDTSTTNKFVTASDITNWNGKSDFSGSYNDLTDKPTIPTLDSSVSTSSTNGVENKAITNYVNNKLSYYTTEELVGKWYDGKNLYKLTVEDTLGDTNGSWKEIQVFTANYVKYIAKMEGVFIPANGNFYVFPFFRGTDSSYANREYVLSNLNPFNGKMAIVAYHSSNYANVYAGRTFYITFYYTKASDYS